VTVLKGACTLIAAPNSSSAPAGVVWVCDRGNPGMACAGMGDVLTGAIGGLLVQLRDPTLAARTGVLAHAMAGDDAAWQGQRGMLALDLMAPLRRCLNP
jgi:ADP-dependent NAD(P)H-hydrate dehydratase / NAD(P)H-hydrate epimerase